MDRQIEGTDWLTDIQNILTDRQTDKKKADRWYGQNVRPTYGLTTDRWV